MPMRGVEGGGDKIRRQQKMVVRAHFSFYNPTFCYSQMGDLVVKEPSGQRGSHCKRLGLNAHLPLYVLKILLEILNLLKEFKSVRILELLIFYRKVWKLFFWSSST
jgi:hypothetical protein